jgi:hypothetical protein
VEVIRDAILDYADGSPVSIIHGACSRGADAIADRLGDEHLIPVERHPADWAKYGKAAGYVRNAEMVKRGADICLAFIENGSKGATMCADLAEKAGIETVRIYK